MIYETALRGGISNVAISDMTDVKKIKEFLNKLNILWFSVRHAELWMLKELQ